MTLPLHSLIGQMLIYFAVFCRVAGLFMTAPALGDFSLIPRIRLVGAVVVTLAITPAAISYFPPWMLADTSNGGASISAAALAALIMGEVVFGLFLGLMARIFMSALNVAGQIIALQMGLSLAQTFDPTQQLQGAIVGGFLAVFGTAMIFATNLHHGLLLALSQSYTLFVPGQLPMVDGMTDSMIEALSQAFMLGFQLAAPFILFGLVFFVGAGVLNRVMPQAQIFFMLMPANLFLGLALLMLTCGLMMTVFLGRFEIFLLQIIG